jgi:small subunit ribosomal protein S20
MPVLKHAKKKLRQDKVRTAKNKKQREQYKDAIKAARKNPAAKAVSAAFAEIDKASKNKLIHKNKAGRLKSSLSKIIDDTKKVVKKEVAKVEGKPAAKATKKKAVKKSSTKKAKK